VKVRKCIAWLKSAVADPLEELNRWERLVRFCYHLLREGARQLSQDRASTMAASLTYRTLFGMLPVTVVGAGVARAIMGQDRFEAFLHNAISVAGLDAVKLGGSEGESVSTLGLWLQDLVSRGMGVNIAALTWIGVLVLVYSALSLMVDIEQSFNVIARSKGGRPWLRRLPVYWFVLTFGPVLVAAAFWVDTAVGSILEDMVGWAWLLATLSSLWGFLMAWVFLLALYRLVPSTQIRLGPAMTGAFVACLLLALGRASLGLYFSHAMSLQHIYGSLGLVPVFMFWLYLMWLVILLGLQVAAILHQVGPRMGSSSRRGVGSSSP
jgi:membrane protein